MARSRADRRGGEQCVDSAGTEECHVRQGHLDTGGLRRGTQLLVETSFECRRRETVNIAMDADDHAPPGTLLT